MAAVAVLPPQDCLRLPLQRRHRKQCFGSAFYSSRPNGKSIQPGVHQNSSLLPPLESPTSKRDKVLHHSKLSDALSMADTRRKAQQGDYFCPRNGLTKVSFGDRKSPKKQRKQTSSFVETKQRFSGVVRILQRPETEEAAKTLLEQFEWKSQKNVSSPETDMGPYFADTTSSVEVGSEQSVTCDAIGCSEEDEVPKIPPLPSKKLLERWAGPGFSNSPPPTCLPVPNFLSMKSRSGQLSDSHLMYKKRMLASESIHLDQNNVFVPCGFSQSETSDVSFVTRDLRRILNLDCS